MFVAYWRPDDGPRLRVLLSRCQTDSNPLARAVANEREFICESIRILYTPYAAPGEGLRPPVILPECLTCASGVLRTLPRMVKGAARVEPPRPRVYKAGLV